MCVVGFLVSFLLLLERKRLELFIAPQPLREQNRDDEATVIHRIQMFSGLFKARRFVFVLWEGVVYDDYAICINKY